VRPKWSRGQYGQLGYVWSHYLPVAEYAFENATIGGHVPKEYISSVDKVYKSRGKMVNSGLTLWKIQVTLS